MELEAPHHGDQLSDDDSEDGAGLEIKVPDFAEFMMKFEKDDDVIHKNNEAIKSHVEGLRLKEQEPEPRCEIIDKKAEYKNMLDANITAQREMQGAKLVGHIEDLNEVIKSPENKIYLK